MKTLDWTRILRNGVITAFLAYGSMSFWTQPHWSMLLWGAAIGGVVELGFQARRDQQPPTR